MITKEINIFNPAKRNVKCIANQFDYLGTGDIFTEDMLEVGKIYTMIKGERKPFGCMVYLEEVESERGFQHYLFEETESYNRTILEKANIEYIKKILTEDN